MLAGIGHAGSVVPVRSVGVPLLLVPVRYTQVPNRALPPELTFSFTWNVVPRSGPGDVPLMLGGGWFTQVSVTDETVCFLNWLLKVVAVPPVPDLPSAVACSGSGCTASTTTRASRAASARGPQPVSLTATE
jgi:hypothetical protein